MKMSSLLFAVTLLTFFANSSTAEVWRASQEWNDHWEKEYRTWVAKKLTTTIFKTEGDLLYGIRTDCADALYAIRIKFAYENSLPFKKNAPDVLRDKQLYFGNDTDMFDNISDEKKRVRAFINYINDESGVDSLLKDTYPVKVKNITAGTLYLVEWQFLGMGKYNKHSYIIKGENAERELIYYYSDAPRKLRTMEVNVGYPRFSFGSAPYGFRAWRQPQHLGLLERDIPAEDGYSREQYELLARVGKKEVLKAIERIRKN